METTHETRKAYCRCHRPCRRCCRRQLPVPSPGPGQQLVVVELVLVVQQLVVVFDQQPQLSYPDIPEQGAVSASSPHFLLGEEKKARNPTTPRLKKARGPPPQTSWGGKKEHNLLPPQLVWGGGPRAKRVVVGFLAF